MTAVTYVVYVSLVIAITGLVARTLSNTRILTSALLSAFLWFSVTPVQASEILITCDNAMKNAETLNANYLWQGATDCARINKKSDSNYLLIIGQIRAMTDMAVLKPESDEEGLKLSELYLALFYKFGGTGFDEVFQDSISLDRLFQNIDTWTGTLWTDYRPGWAFKPKADAEHYRQMIRCKKALRVSQLSHYASLIQNDEYFKLKSQLDELRAGNSGTLKKGTKVYQKYRSLKKSMKSIASNIPSLETQPEECSFIKTYTPDPDANFKQVFKGYNGPENKKAIIYNSESDIMDSWIAKALTATELQTLLSGVDFTDQIVVSMSFGKLNTATGKLYITDVKYNTVYKKMNISGLFGVNELSCSKRQSVSYPFALAVAERPPIALKTAGRMIRNFGDGCTEAVSGSPLTIDK